MATRYRLNRYNWFAQRLHTQGKYEEILRLRTHLARDKATEALLVQPEAGQYEGQYKKTSKRQVSDHLAYLSALALSKTSNRLDEAIYTLQQLNFYKNPRYFLLLCQCLLQLGHSDTVVALGKHVINKQLDHSLDEAEQPQLLGAEWDITILGTDRSRLTVEPKFWYIFAVSLEQQRQIRDAQFAFKMAAELVSKGCNAHASVARVAHGNISTGRINFYEAQVAYAKFCLRHTNDFKSAIQTLNTAVPSQPPNFFVSPLLALALAAQPTATSQSDLTKAIELISSLESHSAANRNPSLAYNRLAFSCKNLTWITDFGDENRNELHYLLAKSFVLLNNMLTESEKLVGGKQAELGLNNQLDKLIAALRASERSAWPSAALWNNLALCYLAKRRFVAAISCLTKAQTLKPLDWRIQYNLALASLQVGLTTRAFACFLAARSFRRPGRSLGRRLGESKSEEGDADDCPLMKTLMAICYEKQHLLGESRRLHIIATRAQSAPNTTVISLINYLIYLHRNSDQDDLQTVKLKLHLLDLLEQCWLQRNQNEGQFSRHLLDVAKHIGDATLAINSSQSSARKTYAWAKMDELELESSMRYLTI